MAKTGCAGSAIAVAPICLNFGITAPVLSCVMTWRGRIETKSPARTTVPAGRPAAGRGAIAPVARFGVQASEAPALQFYQLLGYFLAARLPRTLAISKSTKSA